MRSSFADGRVTKAERTLRIFERNGGVLATVVADKLGQVGRDGARVLVNGRVLVFHFHGQLGGVEDLVLVPGNRAACRHQVVAVSVSEQTASTI